MKYCLASLVFIMLSVQGFAQSSLKRTLGEKVFRALDFEALPVEFREACEPILLCVRFHINTAGKTDTVEYSANMGPVYEGFLKQVKDLRIDWQSYAEIRNGEAIWVTVPVMMLKDPSRCNSYRYDQLMRMMEGLQFKGGVKPGILADGFVAIRYPAVK